jgi:hypothetical protein
MPLLWPDAIFTIAAGGAPPQPFILVFADYLIEKRDRDTACTSPAPPI